VLLQREEAGEGEIAGVPRAGIVLSDVGAGIVALSRIDEAVVEVPSSPSKRYDGRTAMPRDVGDLPSVIGVGGIGKVLGSLVGVGQACRSTKLP